MLAYQYRGHSRISFHTSGMSVQMILPFEVFLSLLVASLSSSNAMEFGVDVVAIKLVCSSATFCCNGILSVMTGCFDK